jgi:hypothetical protein
VLPIDDPLTVPLLRLMIATDDVMHLQKLLLLSSAWHPEEASTDSDRLIHNGETGHLFRLLCGHLFEAAAPFRAVDHAARGRLDEAVKGDDAGVAALATVRHAYGPNSGEGLRHSFLYMIRNKIPFHYRDQELRASFERHVREGNVNNALVMAEASGLSRFTLTDSLLTLTIADGMGEQLTDFVERFMLRIGEAIQLAGRLIRSSYTRLVICLRLTEIARGCHPTGSQCHQLCGPRETTLSGVGRARGETVSVLSPAAWQ